MMGTEMRFRRARSGATRLAAAAVLVWGALTLTPAAALELPTRVITGLPPGDRVSADEFKSTFVDKDWSVGYGNFTSTLRFESSGTLKNAIADPQKYSLVGDDVVVERKFGDHTIVEKLEFYHQGNFYYSYVIPPGGPNVGERLLGFHGDKPAGAATSASSARAAVRAAELAEENAPDTPEAKAARRGCMAKLLGSADAKIETAEQWAAVNSCATLALGKPDPFMTRMGHRSAPVKDRGGELVSSVEGMCFGVENGGMRLKFEKNEKGKLTYEKGTVDFTWFQTGGDVEVTAKDFELLHFRQTTRHGEPVLKRGTMSGKEAGPYVKGAC